MALMWIPYGRRCRTSQRNQTRFLCVTTAASNFDFRWDPALGYGSGGSDPEWKACGITGELWAAGKPMVSRRTGSVQLSSHAIWGVGQGETGS